MCLGSLQRSPDTLPRFKRFRSKGRGGAEEGGKEERDGRSGKGEIVGEGREPTRPNSTCRLSQPTHRQFYKGNYKQCANCNYPGTVFEKRCAATQKRTKSCILKTLKTYVCSFKNHLITQIVSTQLLKVSTGNLSKSNFFCAEMRTRET